MEYNNVNIEKARDEMVEIVRKYKFTMGEFDQASYGVRDYFNRHARLPEVEEDVKENSKAN